MSCLPSIQTFNIIKSVLLRLVPLFGLVYFSAAFGDPIKAQSCKDLAVLSRVRLILRDIALSPGLSGSRPPSPINQNRYSPD